MKRASKVIMGVTLAMVVTLAIVLSLILVLLAELYCSLILCRRQLRLTSSVTANTSINTTSSATAITTTSPPQQEHNLQASSPLTTYYTPGVLQAPLNFLLPIVSCKENKEEAAGNNQHFKLHQVLEIHTQESTTFPKDIGLCGVSPFCPPFVNSPVQIREIPVQISIRNASQDKACAGDKEHLVYISNPIYDNDAGPPCRVDTPFETPDSSPSRLETGGSSSSSSSSGDEKEEIVKAKLPKSCPEPLLDTPPLTPMKKLPMETPMKKLPMEACSVSLRDARSLGTSSSDSVGNIGLSSSSSVSPCTSPSW